MNKEIKKNLVNNISPIRRNNEKMNYPEISIKLNPIERLKSEPSPILKNSSDSLQAPWSIIPLSSKET